MPPMRAYATTVALLFSGAAHAQTVTESGWTPLFNELTDGDVTAVAVSSGSAVSWASHGGDANAGDWRRVRTRAPGGGLTTVHVGTDARGLGAVGNSLLLSQDPAASDGVLLRVGANDPPVVLVGDLRPGVAADVEPGAVSLVPSSWVGGNLLVGNELLVTDRSDNDLVIAVTPAGLARTISTDPGNGFTLIGAAASSNRVLVADSEGERILELTSLSGPTSSLATISIVGGLGGAPLGIVADPAGDSFIVALDTGSLVRIGPPSGPTWPRTVIGTGFVFDADATQVLAIAPDGVLLAVGADGAVHTFARCGLGSAADCDSNAVADVCEVELSGVADCDHDAVLDGCELFSGEASDCDSDSVPDACAPCRAPVDLVFVVDTSSAMQDEIDALCDNLGSITGALAAEGIELHAEVLGVAAGSVTFSCTDGSVGDLYGTAVPGSPAPVDVGGLPANQDTLYAECPTSGAESEDWGRALSVVIGTHPWRQDAIRVAVPVSDEGPWCGSGVDEADLAAVLHAADLAAVHNVIVSPILASEYPLAVNAGVEGLAALLAGSTSGQMCRDAGGPALVEGVQALVRGACTQAHDCDRDGTSDICQPDFEALVCPGLSPIDSDGDGVPDGSDLCLGDDSTGDRDADGLCNDREITVSAITPMVPGQLVQFRVERAPPGERVVLFVSARGPGSGPCAPGGSLCVGLARPVLLGVVRADASGQAIFTAPLPAAVPMGRTVWFQAAWFDTVAPGVTAGEATGVEGVVVTGP